MTEKNNELAELKALLNAGNKMNKNVLKLDEENKQIKEEILRWQTQYAKAYVDRQNALIAEKVELQQQLKEKDEEIKRLFNRFILLMKKRLNKLPLKNKEKLLNR